MQDVIRRVDACRVCGGTDWIDVLSFGAKPLANGFLEPAAGYPDEPSYPLDVAVCPTCWLMSLRQVIDPAALFSHYVYVTSDSDQMRRHMRHIVELCTRRAGLSSGQLVVEMGSNIGTQLSMFRGSGYRTVGVDPARNLAEIANGRGIPTLPTFFGAEVGERIAQHHGRADLVLGRQCFAHIDDVHDVLNGVDAVLSPDGTVVIEVPYLLDLLAENQFDTIYHEHLSYLSLTTFGHLFARHGLRVVDVERVPVHGGSILVFGARETSGRQPAPAVANLLELERRQGLTSPEAYLAFAARTRRVIGEIRTLVRKLAAAGKRVAGYGAPSKGTALLQFCGLGPDEVVFCSDTTTLKHGKVLPGTHIPVWSPEQARQQPPDYYLLLAWNYAEEIIHKERDFLNSGGAFIVPIPEPRVVTAGTLPAAA